CLHYLRGFPGTVFIVFSRYRPGETQQLGKQFVLGDLADQVSLECARHSDTRPRGCCLEYRWFQAAAKYQAPALRRSTVADDWALCGRFLCIYQPAGGGG